MSDPYRDVGPRCGEVLTDAEVAGHATSPFSRPPGARAALYLRVDGEPRGQGRPRFARVGQGVRTYTDQATRSYAEQVQAEWIAAGRPRLLDGPYRMHVIAAMARPKGHLRADGSLSAAGLRAPRPTRAPDAGNIAKLAEDALVAVGALPDDRLVVDLRAEKVWAADDGPHLVVYATSLVAEAAA